MTKTQSMYSGVLAELLEIQNICGISKSTDELISANELKKRIDNDPLLVPIVGDFSAGKSTLLNNFIGRENFLKVDMRPETAIPAELYFSKNEYIEQVDEKGVAKRINSAQNASQNCHNLRYFINSPSLQKAQPLTFVDMPGFNSSNNFHNKAIENYISKGAHYIVLIPCESGTLKDEIRSEIENLMSKLDSMKRSCSFFLTKCDTKPTSKIDEIADEIQDQLEMIADDVQIKLISKKDIAPFVDFATGSNADGIVKDYYGEAIELTLINTKAKINTRISVLKSDVDSIKQALNGIIQSKEQMAQEAQNLKNQGIDVQAKTDEILKGIQKQLELNIDELSNLAMNHNEKAVEKRIGQIIQNKAESMISQITQSQCGEIAQRLEDSMRGLDSLKKIEKENVEDSGVMGAIAIGTALLAIANKLEIQIPKWLKKVLIELDKLAPLIKKLALVILKLFSKSKDELEEEARQKIKVEITRKIPEIVDSARLGIAEALKNAQAQMIEALKMSFESQLKEKEAQVKQAIKEHTESKAQTEQKIATCEKQLQRVDGLLAKVRA